MLFLLLGVVHAAVGLAVGLLVQRLLFAPFDLPQFGMNLTTPLFALSAMADRVVPMNTAYFDLRCRDVLALSLSYQAGVVALISFWVFRGQGFSASIYGPVLQFGAAYMLVIVLEPVVDRAVLAGARALRGLRWTDLVEARLYRTN